MNGATPVSLAQLFAGLPVQVPELSVTGISESSRRVVPGGLFLARAGRRHGLEFVAAAVAAGARAVAWEPVPGLQPPQLPAGVAGFAVPGLRAQLGLLADRFFDSPSRALTVTGITGTNGKTTAAWLAARALSASGHRAGYLGTLGFGFPPALEPSELTTPGCIEMHRRLRLLADEGARHAVAEVSSHALDQGRVDGVRFAVAALTNFTRDHLDYHGDLESYAAAKARLFLDAAPGTAVINVGDHWGRALARRLPASTEVLTVALVETGSTPPSARLLGRLTAARQDGLGLALAGDFGEAVLQSPLWGRFNAENLVVATGILLAHGLELAEAVAALGPVQAPPGRMQRLRGRVPGPAVVVDFAHTPDALEKVLRAVREHNRGRVWCVFGCGGDRDRGKRAPMGAAAVALADHVIVTDDNPRGEAPEQIVADILAGTGGHAVAVIRDRAEAIGRAIHEAAPGDVVLVAGKGHETGQEQAGHVRPFADAAVAQAVLDGAP